MSTGDTSMGRSLACSLKSRPVSAEVTKIRTGKKASHTWKQDAAQRVHRRCNDSSVLARQCSVGPRNRYGSTQAGR